jgi:hypothetical protein
VRDPDHALRFDLDTNEDTVERDPTHEGTRGVNGVENPPDGSTRVGFPVLLAKNRVFREPLLDPLSDQLFGFTIGDGDRRAVTFRVVIHEAPEVPQRQCTRFMGEKRREVQQLPNLI